MNKRKHTRITIEGLDVDISDGIGFSSGSANNISRFGIGLTNVANKLSIDEDNYTVVISGHNNGFKLKVDPKWEEVNGHSKIIGVEIHNAPLAWTEFVKNLEPKPDDDDDVWGNTPVR